MMNGYTTCAQTCQTTKYTYLPQPRANSLVAGVSKSKVISALGGERPTGVEKRDRTNAIDPGYTSSQNEMKAMFSKSFVALEKNLVDYISGSKESQSMLHNKLLRRDLKETKLDNVRLQRELSTARKDLATKENVLRNHKCETSSASEIEAELHNARKALSEAFLEKETTAKDLHNAKDLLNIISQNCRRILHMPMENMNSKLTSFQLQKNG